ncbi:MAG: hypothetical protein ACYSWX_04835 [Planctomycetota bacterium]
MSDRFQEPSASRDQRCGPGDAIQVLDFATKDECALWAKQILDRRDQWTQSFGRYDWTFGNAFYVLLEQGEIHRYHAQANEKNRLIASLSGYLDRMLAATAFLEHPGQRQGDPPTPLPASSRHESLGPYWCHSGVHVAGRNPKGSEHADFEGLAAHPEVLFDEGTRAYSAMLSIQKPRFGGGLHVWPGRLAGGHDQDDWTRHLMREPQAFDYPTGALTVIDSFLVHQIQRTITWGDQLRMVGVMHFLYREDPEPHWEYWF